MSITDLTQPTERFAEITRRIVSNKELDAEAWFYRYCGETPAHASKYLRSIADTLRPVWPTADAPVIVDAGAGFGFALIVAVLLGARAAYGVEIYPGMVKTVEAYLPLLPEDVRERIEMTQGTVHEMPYADNSVDIVLSIEAISHYEDIDRFIAETRRVLRPGGALVISDGNNGSNPLHRRRNREIWEAFERGPEGRTVHGHLVGPPYEQRRVEALERHYPAMSDRDRRELARRTAGYTEEQLLAAAAAFRNANVMPNDVYRSGQLASALDGSVMERLFKPRQLASQLDRAGFAARATGYWGGAAGRPWVRTANRILTALSPLTIATAPSFRVVARKR